MQRSEPIIKNCIKRAIKRDEYMYNKMFIKLINVGQEHQKNSVDKNVKKRNHILIYGSICMYACVCSN